MAKSKPQAHAESNEQLEADVAATIEHAHAEVDATTDKGTPIHTEPTKAHSNLRFKRTRSVAVPLFKLIANEPRFFLSEGKLFTGKQIDDKKEAATLMPVTDLETGEMGQIIVGKVLAELLAEQYPDDAYIGKRFELTLRKKADKKYNTYDLFEVSEEA